MTQPSHFWAWTQGKPKARSPGSTHPGVHRGAARSGPDVEAAATPSKRRPGKEAVVCMHDGMLLGQKGMESWPPVTVWMRPESIVLSDVSQTERDGFHVTSSVCGRQTRRYREETEGCQMGGRLEGSQKKGTGSKYSRAVANSPGDVEDGVGTAVSNSVTTSRGARWA